MYTKPFSALAELARIWKGYHNQALFGKSQVSKQSGALQADTVALAGTFLMVEMEIYEQGQSEGFDVDDAVRLFKDINRSRDEGTRLQRPTLRRAPTSKSERELLSADTRQAG